MGCQKSVGNRRLPVRDLDDKYAPGGDIYITGSQALVRLPMMQVGVIVLTDSKPLVSSPAIARPCTTSIKSCGGLGGFEGGEIHISRLLTKTCATHRGTQQASLMGSSKHDGVLEWYGKGPD